MPSEEQQEIILAPPNRHIKVVAVAGSGKSTTIRQRVAHLLKVHGVDPRRMLILMFNKSAQVEFSAKLDQLQIGSTPPSTRTYHSIGSRLCASLTQKGFLNAAELVDDSNKRPILSLARHALNEVVGTTKVRSLQADNRGAQLEFLEFVDFVKSTTAGAEKAFLETGLDHQFECWIECFDVFELARKKSGFRFFSDLIYDPVMMLRSNSDAQNFIANKMAHILVDEYQDINDISHELIRLIAGEKAFVTVVGDDDQTIYEFRGSKPHYLINRFEDTFKNPLTFTLSRTYRYGHTISLIANNVIRNNAERFPKVCISDTSTKPATIKLFQARYGCASLNEAIDTVAAPIEEYRSNGIQYSDCAVLLRLFSGAPAIELALMVKKIPYSLEGARSALNQEPFLTFMSIIKCCMEHVDGQSSETLAKLIPSILSFPPLVIKKAKRERLAHLITTRTFNKDTFLDDLSEDLSKPARLRLMARLTAIEWILKSIHSTPEELIAGYIDKSDAREILKRFSGQDDDGTEISRMVDTFLAFLRATKSQTHAELFKFVDQYRAICDTSTSSVLITTVHRSKGLEWPVVILPRLCETQFPHEKKNQKTDIQSERRLFYVAVTRATLHLILIVPADDLLQKSLSLKRSDVPLSIIGDSDRASRFVYEANIAPSISLAKDIHNSASYAAIEELDNPTPFNEYLTAIGSDMVIAPSRTFTR